MTQDQATAFLQALGVSQIRMKGNGWLEASCPLAPFLHQHHVDHSPSFGLVVNPGKRSYFSCFACQSGSAEELLQMLELYTKHSKDYNFALCHQLLADEVEVLPLPAYSEFTVPLQVFTEWPQYWIDSFTKVQFIQAAYDYLTARTVSDQTMQDGDLRYDPKRQMIIAPYFDVFGRLAGARGRSILSEVSGGKKHYDYSWQGHNNAGLVWYNEPVLNLSGPVVIVEGQFDCWRVALRWKKVLANLTAKPTFEKMKKLGDCPLVIQIPDRDDTGELSVKAYAKFCNQLGLIHKIVWLDEGVKDPDECSPDYLYDKIMELV